MMYVVRMMKIDLSDKSVLVTGGSRGIGAAISRALLAAGARVAVHYQQSEEAALHIVKDNGSGIIVQADLADPGQTREMFSNVIQEQNGLDVLVNNAGIALHSSPDEPDDQWLEKWEKTLRVNLTASSYLCKLALPVFTAQKHGIIINITSRAAHRGDTREYLAYAASKGGLESLTKSLARAYGKDGVAVYGIAPGFTRTDMAQDFIDTYGEEYALNDIALGALTTPEDIAPLVVFLSSGMALHATGTTIDVNAGSYVR